MSLFQELSIEFGLGATDLFRLVQRAPARYKVYEIPKRNGGSRVIAQPSRELKAIQRYVLRHLLAKLAVHDAAMGYVEGRGIAANASAHAAGRVVLKLDFTDFFPSIGVEDWHTYCLRHRHLIDPEDVYYYSRILFWNGGRRSQEPRCLSIGAPTSPALSNILMYDLDVALSGAALRCNAIYTRYADDITASAESLENVRAFEAAATMIVSTWPSPRLTFNEAKRGVYTMGQRRMVTGLVLTPAHEVSIGRERKRLISAMVHKATLGELDAEGKAQLKGWLAFCIATEPDYVSRMRKKYGDAVIDRALKYRVLPRARRDPPSE